ncbi:MAG: monovalent cation/H(+) antiporter subunit G [Acidimicrobiia bacterium]
MQRAFVELLILVGAMFVLLAGLGVLRFPDVYARMHAATKASTLGIALIGVAGALVLEGGRPKALAAVVFIFITAPSAAHFVGRTAYLAEGIDIELAGPDDLATMMEEAREQPE